MISKKLSQEHKDKIIKICERLLPKRISVTKEVKEKIGREWVPTGEKVTEFKDDEFFWRNNI